MDNSEAVLKALSKAGKALKGGEISDLSGVAKPAVDKALKDLLKQNKVVSPKRCYYEIIK
jgi:predicted transcriptional regulator